MSNEIMKQLQDLIRDYSGNSELQINEESSLINDMQLSSLDVINLIGTIEDTYDIEIEDEKIADFVTVKDLVDYIVSKKKN